MIRICCLAVLLTATTVGSLQAADPVAYSCEDGSDVTVTSLETEPPAAIVVDAGRLYALPQRRSASGVRYASSDGLGATTFWIKGDEATFERPRAAKRNCRVVE